MKIKLKNNSEVAHIWAAQSQAEGSASHFFFDGTSIYSYGRHFEIARHVNGVVLFTTRGYSISTAKHKNHVRNAVSNLPVYFVPNFENHTENVLDYIKRITNLQAKSLKSRERGMYLQGELRELIRDSLRYTSLFKKEISRDAIKKIKEWERKLKTNSLFSEKEILKIKAIEKKNREANTKRREELKKLEARELAENMARLEMWRNGENLQIPYNLNLPTALRVKDNEVQSSRGATVSVRSAKALWGMLCDGKDVRGLKLDHTYTVSEWDGIILTIGCHKLERTEIEKIAIKEGFVGVLPEVK